MECEKCNTIMETTKEPEYEGDFEGLKCPKCNYVDVW